MVEFFPNTRVFVSFGPVTIHWYGVFYVAAFALAYVLIARWQRYRGLALSQGQVLELVAWGAVGVIAGGRLGYVLLYEPLYYLAHPLEILQLSQGGMSSHGGFIGVAIAVWLFLLSIERGWRGGEARTEPISEGPNAERWGSGTKARLERAPAVTGPASHYMTYLNLLDLITVPAALGLALGRLGNVINHELYLTPLAQLAAVASPLAIAGICYWRLRPPASWRAGAIAGLFLVLYAVFRFGEEWLREPDWIIAGWLTRGQVYTLPLLLLGLYLLKDEADRSHSRPG